MLEDLELCADDCKSAPTPGIKPLQHQVENDTQYADQTRYRAIAARANYLSADRPDIQFSAKEVCRFMADPTEMGMAALKRLGRYLIARPRLVHKFELQEARGLEVYGETGWAGCRLTGNVRRVVCFYSGTTS